MHWYGERGWCKWMHGPVGTGMRLLDDISRLEEGRHLGGCWWYRDGWEGASLLSVPLQLAARLDIDLLDDLDVITDLNVGRFSSASFRSEVLPSYKKLHVAAARAALAGTQAYFDRLLGTDRCTARWFYSDARWTEGKKLRRGWLLTRREARDCCDLYRIFVFLFVLILI